MFSEAARVLTSLLRGEKLPKVSDGGFRTVENKTVFPCCLQDNFVSLPLYLRSLVNWIVCDAISFCFCSRHICSALFKSGTFDSPQKPPPVFNNKESVMSAGNLAVSDLLWHLFFFTHWYHYKESFSFTRAESCFLHISDWSEETWMEINDRNFFLDLS